YYDNFKGAICLVRLFDGTLQVGDKIKMMQTGKVYDVIEVGIFVPNAKAVSCLRAGDVGYLACSIKTISDVAVGDTITKADNPIDEALPGYKKVQPVVFCGIFPVDGAKYEELKEGLEKLKLNDASLQFQPEVSQALGFGFRCGFLGLLHLEIITERLEREFDLDIITTAPSVFYHVHKTNGEMIELSNPSSLPNVVEIDYIEEPIVKASIFTPPEYVGAIMELCQEKRGIYKDLTYLDANRVRLNYTLPLGEIIYDFFDSLKSRTKGYASFDYEMAGYEESDLVKVDILLNGEKCDALSIIVFKDKAYARGRALVEKLKKIIPRQLFEVPIQAAIGGKIIARETIKAMRKDVLAKCYGGDVTRKRKLLEKQKEGKKRMRKVGSVEIPSEAFMSILKLDDGE
ncbi:MAG: translation elongation factor 4, partial [Clostridia bacterium]|nr:translation elongation factor 4 [Clostridia bacterium]